MDDGRAQRIARAIVDAQQALDRCIDGLMNARATPDGAAWRQTLEWALTELGDARRKVTRIGTAVFKPDEPSE
jgi:hypothetical protein